MRLPPGNLFLGAAALLLAVLLPAVAAPPDAPLVLEPFGRERGLSLDSITSLLRDRAGFLWIGTRDGLVLYDGHEATVFRHDITDPASIADNYVRCLYEDREGTLWVGTNGSGLDRFDRARRRFVHHRHDSGDPGTISHDSVNAILEDHRGFLWVTTQIGLNRFDRSSGRFERILPGKGPVAGLPHPYAYALLEDPGGALWVTTIGGGACRLPPGADRFECLPVGRDGLASGRVFALAADARGRVWIGGERGLDRFDPRDGTIVHVPLTGGHPGTVTITSLRIDPGGTLWIGSWRGGIGRLDTETGKLLPVPEVPWLSRARVTAILVGRDGEAWLGTWEHGLARVRSPALPARFVASGTETPDVMTVAEDDHGRTWIGTWGSGPLVVPPGSTQPRRPPLDLPDELSRGTIFSILPDGDGAWLGTTIGLYRLDPRRGIRAFRHDPRDPGSLGPGYVRAIVKDGAGRLWIGVGGSGVYRLRADGRGFTAYRHDPANPATLPDDYVTSLALDPRGTIWVGTRSGGLAELDPDTGRAVRYLPDPGDPHALSFHYVTDLALAPEDTLLVATAGGGLDIGHRGPGGRMVFRRVTARDGLPGNNVRAVAADGGTAWLTTPEGLARVDLSTLAVAAFDEGDGLPAGAFLEGAAATGRETLLFGAGGGLLVLPRGLDVEPPPPAPVVLREIRTLDGPVRGDLPPWELARLEVPWGETLEFSFAILDYREPGRHRFAWRLRPLRDAWVDLGNRRDLTLTGLSPGRYVLEVRGRGSRGPWNEARVPLELVVVPPFWMTGWFRLVLVGAVIAAGIAAHRVRTAALRRRNRELTRLKEQRERALAEMRASREQLRETWARLRRLTRHLEMAKEEERQRIARELHDEMGQALTAAKINLQLLASRLAGIEDLDRARDTIALVDRMIGHVRTLSLDLRPPLLDELGLAAALHGYLEAQAARTGLAIETDLAGLPRGLPGELAITVFRFAQEAVTNVVRHAAATRVRVAARRRGEALVLEVRDDGRGFDVEEALQRAARGRHLGLLGMRERVEALGGEFRITSRPGAGTTITVRVPLTEPGGET